MRRLFLLFLFIGCSLALTSPADAERYKRVSASKYERGTPFKGFKFTYARDAQQYATDPALVENVAPLKVVEYRNDQQERVYGLLDLNGKKPKWIARPEYARITLMGDGLSFLRRRDNTRCILDHTSGACTDTTFETAIYVGTSRLPWLAQSALATYTDAKRLTLALISPGGEELGVIENVAHVIDAGSHSRFGDIESTAFGDTLMMRVLNQAGDAYDTAILPAASGLSVTSLPPFSVFVTWMQTGPDGQPPARHYHEYLFTADIEEGLYWPVYPEGIGFKTAPGNLQGIKPIYDEAPIVCDLPGHHENKESCPVLSPEGANTLCCDKPVAWLAKWLTETGERWAIVRLDGHLPSFDEVLASRDEANYELAQGLGSMNGDLIPLDAPSIPTRRWVLVGANGQTDIFRTKWDYNLNGNVLAHETRFATDTFAAWLDRAREEQRLARIAAETLRAQIRARQAAQAEASERARIAYDRRIAEQRRQDEQERIARKAALEAQWAEIAAIERERAHLKWEMEMSAAAKESPWSRAWARMAVANVQGQSQSTYRPTPDIDYWKSYDASNLTGSYVTRSGAAVGCTLGTGGADC